MTPSTTPLLEAHLRRILDRVTHIIADEVLNCMSLAATYHDHDIGDLHPALGREGHMESLLFGGLRASGYFTMSQAGYFAGAPSRQIDLAVWIPDTRAWLYLEIKPCWPDGGNQPVLDDAQRLIDDQTTDRRDRLKAVLAYGFRWPVREPDGFPQKYLDLSAELEQMGFSRVGIRCRSLEGTRYLYVQVGLWILNCQPAHSPVG
jgi:hypothetical protein